MHFIETWLIRIKISYILRLNTTLSEKIALPAKNPTEAMIGRLIVAPAMPVGIPISIDKLKANNITTKAYQPRKPIFYFPQKQKMGNNTNNIIKPDHCYNKYLTKYF